jgi:hypothetical protein
LLELFLRSLIYGLGVAIEMYNVQQEGAMNEEKKTKRPDKTLQDDWMPDLERRPGATSCELPEYGGDIKQKDSIEKGPSRTPPEYWNRSKVSNDV